MPSSQRNFAYYVERDAIAIVKRSVGDTSTTYNSPSEVKTVTIFAVKRPNKFVSADTGTTNTTTGYTEEPDIPEEFRHAIVAKAIQKGYELNPDTLQVEQVYGVKTGIGTFNVLNQQYIAQEIEMKNDRSSNIYNINDRGCCINNYYDRNI